MTYIFLAPFSIVGLGTLVLGAIQRWTRGKFLKKTRLGVRGAKGMSVVRPRTVFNDCLLRRQDDMKISRKDFDLDEILERFDDEDNEKDNKKSSYTGGQCHMTGASAGGKDNFSQQCGSHPPRPPHSMSFHRRHQIVKPPPLNQYQQCMVDYMMNGGPSDKFKRKKNEKMKNKSSYDQANANNNKNNEGVQGKSQPSNVQNNEHVVQNNVVQNKHVVSNNNHSYQQGGQEQQVCGNDQANNSNHGGGQCANPVVSAASDKNEGK